MTEPTVDMLRDAGSGVCELTNQSRLGICAGGALKRQELKQGLLTKTSQQQDFKVWILYAIFQISSPQIG